MTGPYLNINTISDRSTLFTEKNTITSSLTLIQKFCVVKERNRPTLHPSIEHSKLKSISKEIAKYNYNQPSQSTNDELYELYKKGIRLDCAIIVLDNNCQKHREVRFPIHKLALIAHVDKSDSNIPNEVNLTKNQPSLNISLLQPVVNFLYTRNIHITENNVEDLLNIADALKLTTLKNCCSLFLSKPSPNNVIKYYLLAKKWNLETISTSLLNYTKQQVPNVLLSPDIILLDSDTLYSLLGKFSFK